jgi:hypothetical protein
MATIDFPNDAIAPACLIDQTTRWLHPWIDVRLGWRHHRKWLRKKIDKGEIERKRLTAGRSLPSIVAGMQLGTRLGRSQFSIVQLAAPS